MAGAGRQRPPASQPQQQFWGWHRLHPDRATELVRSARIRPGQLVVDLGAGEGVITEALASAGARVLAVELHPHRVDQLRRRFAGVDAVCVLELDLRRFRLPRRPFRVVANPPWSLAKPIIRMLTAPGSRLVLADLVLQRRLVSDVAARGTPGSGKHRFTCTSVGAVPRTAFHPAPPHPAAVLRITPSRSSRIARH
ncbi:rRNA adenine N-6-methyltransferase family protein [Microlunatus sp. Gsoil 973]|uniref:rRNA adenine N-6-methyltransferase family protein n=1 Tax=Microlunatus sp. Gsoil 973 TaxID=2672569 RepID=UPI0012B492DC|nr:rRNA adenine N-6-methyltransferase family protein [Microlunatus sp. Gsoil 973]QGN34524.1 methyltransferase domain-containing protein [Microlunatus sp. Gsoil 973]